MGPFSNYLIVELSGISIAIICAAYFYLEYVAFNYWSSRNIPFVKPKIPFGNLWSVITGKDSLGELFRDKYHEFKQHPVFGVYSFHKPSLVINDPDLIRTVMTKEFAHFHDRGMYHNEKIDPLSMHLFSLPGARWRYLRTKFSPAFTSSKIKQMFFTVKECSEHLVEFLEPKANKSELIEIKDLMARYSTDTIASVAFGLKCNSIDDPNTEFRKWGRKIFEPQPLKITILLLLPQLAHLLKMSATDKEFAKFFIAMFKDTVEYRTANNVVRKDFMDLLIQLINKGFIRDDHEEKSEKSSEPETHNERISMLEGAAQAFLFWMAGFETSSTTATFCIYELSQHQDIQDKLADEINTVMAEFGGLTYESVNAMTYLHKVVSETMRKHTSVPMLNRQCTKAFDLPGTGLRVEKGTSVIIPVLGIHLDPDHYPDPQKFDPERFTEKNIAERHQYAYLPFGEGPRNCIGMRFGLVQTKVALISLLSKYRFTPGPEMPVPLPVDKGGLTHAPAGGVTLRIEMR